MCVVCGVCSAAACWCGGVVVCVCWSVLACAVVCAGVLVCAGAVCWCVASLTAAAAGYIVGRLACAQVVVVGVALAILRRLEAGRQGVHRVGTHKATTEGRTRRRDGDNREERWWAGGVQRTAGKS